MRVNGDFYLGMQDTEDLIRRLISLKENIEGITDAQVIDEAVEVLYEVIENGEE